MGFSCWRLHSWSFLYLRIISELVFFRFVYAFQVCLIFFLMRICLFRLMSVSLKNKDGTTLEILLSRNRHSLARYSLLDCFSRLHLGFWGQELCLFIQQTFTEHQSCARNSELSSKCAVAPGIQIAPHGSPWPSPVSFWRALPKCNPWYHAWCLAQS